MISSNESFRTTRWYSSWVLFLGIIPIFVMYGIWGSLTISGRLASVPEGVLEMAAFNTQSNIAKTSHSDEGGGSASSSNCSSVSGSSNTSTTANRGGGEPSSVNSGFSPLTASYIMGTASNLSLRNSHGNSDKLINRINASTAYPLSAAVAVQDGHAVTSVFGVSAQNNIPPTRKLPNSLTISTSLTSYPSSLPESDTTTSANRDEEQRRRSSPLEFIRSPQSNIILKFKNHFDIGESHFQKNELTIPDLQAHEHHI
jgi:hypothetical protein